MNRRGFVPILVLLIIAATIAVGGGTWWYRSKISIPPQTQQSPTPTVVSQNSSTPPQPQATANQNSNIHATIPSATPSPSPSSAVAKAKKASVPPAPIKIIPPVSTPVSKPAPTVNVTTTVQVAVPTPAPQPPSPVIVNGKTLAQRLQEASDRLHTAGSGQQIRNDFPDIQLVYTDLANGTGFPSMILPFKYYYSQEANTTFSICAIDFTVLICNGKLDSLVTKEDITSKRCTATPVYLQDPRIGGSGQYF